MRRTVTLLWAALLLFPALVVVAVGGATPAHAENNGVGTTPALGWSSWSFIRHNPTAANIEAQAAAMASSGLAKAGFQYVNLDDFYYECPSGGQGPNVDGYGRWVTDPAKFPSAGGKDGLAVVADQVHKDGLKFGVYVTPGISKQAVARNTPIEGTSYHARDIATTTTEKNYNCKGMVGIDYSKPGAQAFIDSWAKEFASWGVDYLKIDGVGTSDIPDIQSWSQALRDTGRPIHLELSNSLAIGSAPTWAQYSNGWRTGGDIECYSCESGGSSYPLTDWKQVSGRFNTVADWAPYGGPGAFNDYDSTEIGNGTNDGLSPAERQTQLSLWSLASSPLILGTDLTHLDKTDLGYLTNADVLAVDQDAIDAKRISSSSTSQVFAKKESNGDVIVGLFNTGGSAHAISTTASAIGLPSASGYTEKNLWTHRTTNTGATISADVPSHGVALYRLHTAAANARFLPPSTTVDVTGLDGLGNAQPATVTASFTNNGTTPLGLVRLGLSVPSGWTAKPFSGNHFGVVRSGQTVQATYQVTPSAPQVFQTSTITGTADYLWGLPQHQELAASVLTSPPVQAPYRTYSSATDGPAQFAQAGSQLGVSGAGADLFSGTDSYSSVYLPGAVGPASTVQAEVSADAGLRNFGKSGIMVRNSIPGSGTTPEGVVLFVSPSGGIQLEWNDNGGSFVDQVTPANGTIPAAVPVWLKLTRSGATYTGSYSTDNRTWQPVGTATVPDQLSTQDAGVFVTSHIKDDPATSVFSGFTVS